MGGKDCYQYWFLCRVESVSFVDVDVGVIVCRVGGDGILNASCKSFPSRFTSLGC